MTGLGRVMVGSEGGSHGMSLVGASLSRERYIIAVMIWQNT